MCGILAVLGLEGASVQEIRDRLSALSRRIRHRGPDWSGNLVFQMQNGKYAALYHERLAIVDPASGEQPLMGCEDKVAVCVNGEIYNHILIRQNLQSHNLRTGSDCEVISHLYEEHGDNFVSLLDGMFACALYDKENERLLAFRDHVGICSLYIGWGEKGEVWISSELKAIHDQCAMFQTFLPGQIYDSKTNQSSAWYNPQWYDIEHIPTLACEYEVLRNRVEEAVVKRMMTDVPYGVLISGGLDSSIISAVVVKHASQRVETNETEPAWFPRIHSFAVGLDNSPDLKFAKEVADYLGTVHHQFNFTIQGGIDALREVIYHLETYNPTTIRASVPMYFMARRIKSMGFKMVLSGEGADEVFGGYLYFHKAPDKVELHKETVEKVQNLHLYDLLRGNKSMLAFGVELRVPFLDRSLLDYAMGIDPEVKIPRNNDRNIEKYILRKAFEGYLPESVLWRQKEQFSDGVGYGWIDGLKDYAERTISDEQMQNAGVRFQFQTPVNKEAYLYRQIFESLFPEQSAISTVPQVRSVACSTARALQWDEAFQNNVDESGRSVLGVHSSDKKF